MRKMLLNSGNIIVMREANSETRPTAIGRALCIMTIAFHAIKTICFHALYIKECILEHKTDCLMEHKRNLSLKPL